jgi:hypothetical protein
MKLCDPASLNSAEMTMRLMCRIFLLAAVFLVTAGASGAVYGEEAFSPYPATPALHTGIFPSRLLLPAPGDAQAAPRYSRPDFLSVAPDGAEGSLDEQADPHAADPCIRSERRFPTALGSREKKKNLGTHDAVLDVGTISSTAALRGQKLLTLNANPLFGGMDRSIRLGEPRASPSSLSLGRGGPRQAAV